MKKFCKAVIEDNVIHLEEKLNLPNGMYSIVILQPMRDDKQEEIKNRQLRLLENGFDLGKKMYSKREDLYGR